MFPMWRIYSPLRSLLRLLTHIELLGVRDISPRIDNYFPGSLSLILPRVCANSARFSAYPPLAQLNGTSVVPQAGFEPATTRFSV